MAFLHLEILIMLLFLLPLSFMLANRGCSIFYDIISYFSCNDLDAFCDYIRDVTLEHVFNKGGSVATSKFSRLCDFMLELIYIPHTERSGQPYPCIWIFCACVSITVHRNTSFNSNNRSKLMRQAGKSRVRFSHISKGFRIMSDLLILINLCCIKCCEPGL